MGIRELQRAFSAHRGGRSPHLGYLVITALVAIVVYEKLGVAILRRAWFNIDLLWMLALMITGVFILVF
jgi:hypothetical protein